MKAIITYTVAFIAGFAACMAAGFVICEQLENYHAETVEVPEFMDQDD